MHHLVLFLLWMVDLLVFSVDVVVVGDYGDLSFAFLLFRSYLIAWLFC